MRTSWEAGNAACNTRTETRISARLASTGIASWNTATGKWLRKASLASSANAKASIGNSTPS